MTQLEQQIKRAQHRLWFDRWLARASASLAMGAVAYALVVLVQRLFDLPLPLRWVALGTLGAVLIASVAWAMATRESVALAAARLDEAAGLRERISSGLHCRTASDPFAQAVVVDAQHASGTVTVRQHLKLHVPRTLGWAGAATVLAGLMFLMPAGLLRRTEASVVESGPEPVNETRVVVKKKFEQLRQLAETNPALDDLKEDLKDLKAESMDKFKKAGDLRHEAAKRIDKLSDAVKEKRENPKYEAAEELKKMMRSLRTQEQQSAPTQKLRNALAQGDFKTAKEEIKHMQEQLATLKGEKDQKALDKMSKQLDDLAKRIQEAAKDKELAQKLEQAGVKKEDVERMLEQLKKKDLDQVKQQLQKQGFSQQQIQQIAQQMQKSQQASQMAKQMAQSLQQGAQCNNPGQAGQAMDGLQQAGDQMSDLEAMQQEMQQLESVASALDQAKQDMDQSCSNCNGTGQKNGKPCSQCNGSGSCGGQGQGKGNGNKRGGMGSLGKGRGGLAPEADANVAFKVERGKVPTGKGAITGMFLVDGEQVKGDVSTQLTEVIAASEREASDRINRDRVPRQYQKAIKEYFGLGEPAIGRKVQPKSEKEADEKSAEKGKSGNDD